MKYIFNFPDIGEGLEEGTIIEWLIKKGQKIEVGDLLVTMETDKVVAEIPAPRSGVISALYGKEGETIHVGDALVEIEIEGLSGEDAIETVMNDKIQEQIKEEGAGVVGTLEVAGNNMIMSGSDEGFDETESADKPVKRKIISTPVARAMAKNFGIDINLVKGNGPAGRVMKEDILNFSKQKTKSSIKQESAKDETNQLVEIEPLTQIRKTIAKNMIASKHNAAHMSVFDEVEISELDRIRKKYKQKFEDKNIKLTYLAFVVKAVAIALKKYKSLNSEMDTVNDNMIYKKYYNIGIAVDTEKGLMVPVIKNADKLGIAEIAEKIQELSEKGRTGKITLDDMRDGTFTITSYGSIGGKFAVPVINFPQAGILGVGKVTKQPIVKDDKLDIGLVMPLSISVDHRIVDGGDVTRFLNTVMEYLNEPVSLLVE
ncbi:MAG: 2-oxo acid dehydrogenase subunit E2 [Bacteroidales bacterium]|nr:2-oxo acid dehydrogenase subunit E2 [Bacteroidales bacterium]MBN2758251.1 2-oxo acid dehydrogenase subunit E2 [Bacteroidales bacterium]